MPWSTLQAPLCLLHRGAHRPFPPWLQLLIFRLCYTWIPAGVSPQTRPALGKDPGSSAEETPCLSALLGSGWLDLIEKRLERTLCPNDLLSPTILFSNCLCFSCFQKRKFTKAKVRSALCSSSACTQSGASVTPRQECAPWWHIRQLDRCLL